MMKKNESSFCSYHQTPTFLGFCFGAVSTKRQLLQKHV